MRSGKVRLIALSMFTAAALVAAPGIAAASSDQSCSQRGGKKNSVDCSSVINVSGVTVNLSGNRILTDNSIGNDNEISILEGSVVNVLNNSLNCNAIVAVLSNTCSKNIADDVIVKVSAFTGYTLKSITVTAFGQPYSKKCPCK